MGVIQKDRSGTDRLVPDKQDLAEQQERKRKRAVQKRTQQKGAKKAAKQDSDVEVDSDGEEEEVEKKRTPTPRPAEVAKAKAPKRKREETEATEEGAEGAPLTAKEKNQAKKARQQANREKKETAANSKGEDAETIARKASKKARQKERQKARKEAGVENKWSTKKPGDEKKTEEAPKVKKVKVAKENTHANQTVVQMAKGVQMIEKTVGKGVVLTKGSKVKMAYTGRIGDRMGVTFDSNKNFTFCLGVGEVIEGWDVGIEGMREGGLRTLTIPARAAYGNTRRGKIPPNSQLFFEVRALDSSVNLKNS